MLLSLTIKNFLLIEYLVIDFTEKFVAITGETGSGKSMLIESLLFCLGGKSTKSVIRIGADSCFVYAEFSIVPSIIDILTKYSISIDESIIIKRCQYLNGKRKFFINDEIVSTKVVNLLATELIEVHGQHSYTDLFSQTKQLNLIDNYGDLSKEKQKLSQIFWDLSKLKDELNQIIENENKLHSEVEYLKFACKELSEANVKENEEDSLSNERIKLQAKQKNYDLVQHALGILDNGNVLNSISKTQRILTKTNEFEGLIDNLEQAYLLIDGIFEVLKSYQSEDLDKLDVTEQRLFFIRNLARKHNTLCQNLSKIQEGYEKKLTLISNQIDIKDNLLKQIKLLQEQYDGLALELSKKRKLCSLQLKELIDKELQFLNMPHAQFYIVFSILESTIATGFDRIDFQAQINPGMPIVAISDSASGGELSRLMLAIRIVLLKQSVKQLIIFDEIDTGTSGEVANNIGHKLKSLSNTCQVIAISHQAQVAAKASQHIKTSKAHDSNKTTSIFINLNYYERIDELSRMMAGNKVSDNFKRSAAELLNT